MLHQLTSASLNKLTKSLKRSELSDLVSNTRTANGSASAYLKNKIRVFEVRYEMSSEELLITLETGKQNETADIAEWLFLLDTLKVHEH